MVNQTIHTQDSVAGSLLKAAKTGKGGAKGGAFAKLITSFQKHIKQAESGLHSNSEKTSGKALAANGLKKVLLKVSEGADAAGKAKALLKVDVADKTSKGEHAKGKLSLNKSLSHTSNNKALAKHAGEMKNSLNKENLVVDDTKKLQKDVEVGLGVFQQESHQSVIKKVGRQEAKEKLLAGVVSKNNKNTEVAEKSPHLVKDTQVAEKSPHLVKDTQRLVNKKGITAEQKKSEVGQNKVEKKVAEALVTDGKAVGTSSDKQVAQGRFSLKDVDGLDNDTDISKLIKRDGLDVADLKDKMKGNKETSAKSVSLASAANANDDVKVMSQDQVNNRQMYDLHQAQTKQIKDSSFQHGLDAAEKVSEVKASLKAVAAHRSGILGVQPQNSASVMSNIQPEAIMASANGKDANMSGDDRGMGHSAAELLMGNGSTRDARATRNDFAMQMAYRSAASFKPSDAMLEISKAAKDGKVKLDLMLEPATLGKIQVSLQTDAQKQIQVHLIVDQQSSRQVLDQQLPQLRQALADQGLNLSGFTMDMNSHQQSDGKASHDVARMEHMNSHGELENVMPLETPLHMGVNMADDGSLSILA